MARTAYVNGKVITVDGKDRIVEAVLVNGKEIEAVGSSGEVLALANDSCDVVNLEGRTMIPGFIDAHNHLTHQGAAFSTVDFGYPAVSSLEELRAAVKTAAGHAKPGQWIRGWGMNYEKYPEGRIPTRWDIDELTPDNPVCIVHVSGHNVLVNSKALELAGVDNATPDPDGGMFVRDENKRLTGYAYDSAQQLVIPTSVDVGHHGPDIGYDLPLEELVDHIDIACHAYLKEGITSVVDPQVTTREMPGYMEARRQDKLTVKVTCMYLSNHQDAINELGITDRIGNDLLSIGPMKYYCDGSLIGGTALFYADEPQHDHGCKCNKSAGRGYTYWPDVEAFKEALIDTHARGLQFGVHTQGDMAMDIVLDAVEEAQRRHPRPEARHRIEHCHGPTREQVKRIKRLGIIPVTQPGQINESGDDLMDIYGERRALRFCPLKDMQDEGIPYVVSTDAFVQSYRPFDAIYAAVGRKSLTGRDMGEAQAISVLDAIRAYTINAAHSVYHENYKGSIEVGKLADLTIIDADLLSVPVEDIPDLTVWMTISDGKTAYRKQQ